jgi:hypothetical protein
LVAQTIEVFPQLSHFGTRITLQGVNYLPVDIAASGDGCASSLKNIPDVAEHPIISTADRRAVKLLSLLV